MTVSCAAPPRAEAVANPTTPMMSVRLGPIMSLMRPPSSRSPPKPRVYAVITHWRSASENPRECCAEGRAISMMVVSSTTMSWAQAMTTSTHQWARVAGPRWPAAAVPVLVAASAPLRSDATVSVRPKGWRPPGGARR